MRYGAKVDLNQPEIVRALRKAGCWVVSLAAVGGGVPDLLVGRAGVNYLLEVKMPRGTYTELELEFDSVWEGQVATVRSEAEALAAVGL